MDKVRAFIRFCGIFHKLNIYLRYTDKSMSSTDTLAYDFGIKRALVWIE